MVIKINWFPFITKSSRSYNTKKYSRNTGIDSIYEPANKELKIRLTYSYFTIEFNLSRILIESLILTVNNVVNNLLDRVILSNSPSI